VTRSTMLTMRRGVSAVVLLACGAALLGTGSAEATTLEPVGTYAEPVSVSSDPSSSDRLFVVQRGGQVMLTTAAGTFSFLDISPSVATARGGLLSAAFAPDFATTGHFYVAYTGAVGVNNSLIVDEYTAAGNSAPAATRREVLAIPTGTAATRLGGQLQFGPDSYLYIGIGDAGTQANAQTLTNLLGKVLRIDPRGVAADQFTIPTDNPFYNTATGVNRAIWSFGLRSPSRISFDAAGALAIADAGGAQQEVEYASAGSGAGKGLNYGWPNCEGAQACPMGVTPPNFSYPNSPTGCAIAGGYVVGDATLTGLAGRYLFSDACGGDLRSIDPLTPPAAGAFQGEGLSVTPPVGFGEDSAGRLYLASTGSGEVFRLACSDCDEPPPTPPPVADTTPPETTIVSRKIKSDGRAKVFFSSNEAGSTFTCRLDKRKPKPCTSPRKLKHLDEGRHKVRIAATDPAGNADLTPAKAKLRIRD
jgi:Glucose / Sorbosone dehydrogenase